jgi:hypothetical protein
VLSAPCKCSTSNSSRYFDALKALSGEVDGVRRLSRSDSELELALELIRECALEKPEARGDGVDYQLDGTK